MISDTTDSSEACLYLEREEQPQILEAPNLDQKFLHFVPLSSAQRANHLQVGITY